MRTFAVLVTLAAIGAATMARGQTMPAVGGNDAIWRDAKRSPDERARDLLPRLTLEEKIGLVHADGTFSTAGLPRFGIGKLWMSDGPQGVREEIEAQGWNAAGRTDDFATAMPADIGLAASFDPELAKAFGGVIGEEAAVRGKNIMLCPGMNIMRTPLNGRNSEYFGEDPFLASRMAVGFITGLQAQGVAACAKHYALNNQEFQRNSIDVQVDDRALHEIYLPAFKAAVTEGHVWSVMTAYNKVRGDFCSENDLLINQILKRDWGFQGLVMSDWGGVHSTVKAAVNGTDLEMGSNVGKKDANGANPHDQDFFAAALAKAVEEGQVPMARLNDMVLRNLRVMAATGMLDGSGTDRKRVLPPLMAPAHVEVARKVAESGIVLLKNERQVLPLDSTKIKSIAVIGYNANAKFAHDGNSAQIKTSYEVTPLEGITKRAGEGVKVTYVPGFAPPPTGRGAARGRGRGAATIPATQGAANPLIEAAVDAAKSADVAIVVAGLYRGQDQEGADRRDMNLPPGQAELIQAVTAANPRTVVVLNGGAPVSLDPWLPAAAGVLFYWYGGTEGGTALARVLFGDVNPSGHLPCSYPRQLADSPAHAPGDAAVYPGQAGKVEYREGMLVGYRWFDAKNIEPLFPFGFGLSYTSFALSDLSVIQVSNGNLQTVNVSFAVSNTGQREGAEVVQLYVGQNNPSVPRPPKELKAFRKIALKPGEKGTVTMTLDAMAFAHYEPGKHAWVADAGQYTIYAGDSAGNVPLKAIVALPMEMTIPEGR